MALPTPFMLFGIPVITQANRVGSQLLVLGGNGGSFNARGWNRQ